jgi:hypothetical protein
VIRAFKPRRGQGPHQGCSESDAETRPLIGFGLHHALMIARADVGQPDQIKVFGDAAGVLTGRVALVDPGTTGFGLTVFVSIQAPDHSLAWRQTFARAVDTIPAIMELYRRAEELCL